MATFYVPRDSAVYRSWVLRWGLMAIGAICFMQVFLVWSGSLDDIPFGEIEGVNLSDPSLLTTVYGWSVTELVNRYMRLATVCLVILAGMYVWGLISSYISGDERRLNARKRVTNECLDDETSPRGVPF